MKEDWGRSVVAKEKTRKIREREKPRIGVGGRMDGCTVCGIVAAASGWRNRNYLVELSEATEEKELVARSKPRLWLKYRKFKHHQPSKIYIFPFCAAIERE